jgi:hypothetical protein
MKLQHLIILPITLMLFISGCASVAKGPLFTESKLTNDGTSVVYIYRPKLDATNSLSPPQNIGTLNVIIDGKRVAEVSQNGYVPISLSTGNHIISFSIFGDSPLVNVKLAVQPNQKYYVKLTDKVDEGILTTDFLNTIEIMENKLGKLEISNARLEQ